MKNVFIEGIQGMGKSTLLNQLTDAGSLAEDKLFATLDPITRNLRLKDGQELLVTDTVGFIRKLPTIWWKPLGALWRKPGTATLSSMWRTVPIPRWRCRCMWCMKP